MSDASIPWNAAQYSSNVMSPAWSFSANASGSFAAAAISRSSYLTSAAWLSCMCSASRPRLPISAAVLLCRMLWAPSQSAFILKLPPPFPMKSPACTCSDNIPERLILISSPTPGIAFICRSTFPRIAVVPCSTTSSTPPRWKPRTMWS